MLATRRGRPSRFAEYDQLVASLPAVMEKRPKYLNGIGVFRGSRGITAWLKIRLPHGGMLKGKSYAPNASVEIKVGSLGSWDWEKLTEKHRDLQGKADRGEALEGSPDVTFEQFAEQWLARAEARIKTYSNEKLAVRKSLIAELGNISLRHLSAADINRWIAKRLNTLKPRSKADPRPATRIKPGTVQREFNTLRAILNDAARNGLIERSPTPNVGAIQRGEARQRFLTNEELVALLAIAEKEAEWLPDFILWAVHSGMRKGEMQALTWADIREFGADRVMVDVKHSKSGQPRFVVATRTMRDILERQKGRRIAGDDRVFPISKMTLRRRWEGARASAGLSDVTIHDLRRTHSTHAAIAGVDLRTLAGRIGHTNLDMLQKHYAALVGSAGEEAAEKIEMAFAPSDRPRKEPSGPQNHLVETFE
jgi:integrase